MSDLQIYQLLGGALFLLGLSWVINKSVYRKLIKDIAQNEGTLLLTALGALVMGYLLVFVHQTDSLLILLIGWSAILKGVALIFFPVFGWNIYKILKNLKHYFGFLPWLVLLCGAAFLYLGSLA